MYPWELCHNDPKKIITTDLKGDTKQVAYCATPGTANLILHRCESQPVLLEACRELDADIKAIEAHEDLSETWPDLAVTVAHVRLAIAAADPTKREG